MGIETAILAAGVSEDRRKSAEEKSQKRQRLLSQRLGTTDREEDRLQRVGRSALIATSDQGVLNENIGRKKLTAN